MPLLNVQHINCRYNSTPVIEDLSFSLEAGQIACLLGPSGCGKTTALRAIAGFEPIGAGNISLDGRVLSDEKTMTVPESRGIGMVFQDYALFPHLNVQDNIAFGLSGLGASEKQQVVDDLLNLINLSDYADVYPHQLSGGQQQRVALARTLAPDPSLILLDEPFSNLDTELRRSLSLEVRTILKARNTTAILVTHDRTEAFNMADVIGVMHEGKISQWADAKTLYQQPSNAFVANFICDGSFLPAKIQNDQEAETSLGTLHYSSSTAFNAGDVAQLLIRPWEVQLAKGNQNQQAGVPATIIEHHFHGSVSITSLKLSDGSLVESSDEHLAGCLPDSDVNLSLLNQRFLAFPA